jgi:hypothetical protein
MSDSGRFSSHPPQSPTRRIAALALCGAIHIEGIFRQATIALVLPYAAGLQIVEEIHRKYSAVIDRGR